MDIIKIKSYAKINLCLEILKRLPNNYHEISSLMQRISLYDVITVKKTDKGIYLKTDIEELNKEIEQNTALLASKLFFEYTKIKNGGAQIYIKKNIPHQAGLGGSSSNAASIINALDYLYKTNLTYGEKLRLGVKVGCDVGFFFSSGTCLIGGTGEIIIKKKKLIGYYVIVIKPEFGISTKQAYESLNPAHLKQSSSAENLYLAYLENNLEHIKKYSVNTFEEFITQREYIKTIKLDLIKNDAAAALMTGSGSCVFGIFDNNDKCEAAYNNLKNNYEKIFKAKFI